MPIQKLIELLDRNGIKYAITSHSVAYTAQEVAALTHTPGQELAKTVIVEVDGALAMAVLPAAAVVDVGQLREAVGAKSLTLAKEHDFKSRFADCEPGSMPPFGNLYGMAVFVDENLTRDRQIAFNAGSHRELMRLSYNDFERLVKPTVLRFALQRTRAA